MRYVYTTDTTDVATYLASTIRHHLEQGDKVLWLLSGGSGATVCVAVARQLIGVTLDRLYVTLSDERYGSIGHRDENWQQLLDSGLSLPEAHLYRPLQGKDRSDTTAEFGAWLQTYFESVDYRIGVFGIGPDGHTAGIKPGTSAVQATGWATDFVGQDFERITITFDTIKRLDEAVIQAMGAEKFATIDQLLHQDSALRLQPAQVLKQVKKSTLYTDYKEE